MKKIFVVSWFFVPITTSESLVTYKLLANSKNEYYVCYAKSNKWSYKINSKLESENIKTFAIDTEDFDDFNNEVFNIYKKLSKEIKFDAIMTRSLLPESQYVGIKIHEMDKDIPWIISLNDPIANNPYETYVYFLQNRHRIVRDFYLNAPHFFLNKIAPLINRPSFKKLAELYKLETRVINEADLVLTPCLEQAKFIMYDKELFDKKSLIVPHSYESSFYKKNVKRDDDKFVFSFIGHSDNLRSLIPVVKAVNILKDINPNILKKIKVKFVGNVPQEVEDMIYVFFLQNVFSIEKPCDYFESLKLMQSSDCLIHVDAKFFHLENGSIFFAAKIADYLGAKKPILGITNKNCPAGKIIEKCGGICCNDDPYDIAKNMVYIVENEIKINEEEAQKYDAKIVSKNFDDELDRRIFNGK